MQLSETSKKNLLLGFFKASLKSKRVALTKEIQPHSVGILFGISCLLRKLSESLNAFLLWQYIL